MKKLLVLMLVAMLILPCFVTGCNNTDNNADTPTTEQTTQETIPEFVIPEITTPEDTRVTYTVTVVDESGAPLPGAEVQLCVGDSCRLPVPTNAQGIATVTTNKDDYTVKVTLNGYTGEASYTFAADSLELTVQLTKIV